MPTYFAERRTEPPRESDWSSISFAEIGVYPWSGAYRPKAAAALVCCHDRFILRMKALERREYLRMEEQGLSGFVHEDSCMEFFFCPFPGAEDYINFEINPQGAAHIAVGKDRHNRKRVENLPDADAFSVKPFRQDRGADCEWGFTAEITFRLIACMLNIDTYAPPEVLSGNFYICGDKTPVPHYGVWNFVDLPAPDYHRPEFFGRIEIEENKKQ